MRTNLWQAWCAFVVVALWLGYATTSRADWLDTFSNGTTDIFWQFGSDGGNASTFLGGQVIDGHLVLTADATPSNGGINTAFGVVISEVFTNVRMAGIINPANDPNINDTVGLLLRGNTVNQSFYMAEVNYNSSELIIYRNNPVVEGGNSNLAVEFIPDLNFSDSLYVEMEAIGSNLEVWAWTDATKSTLRATTSFNDTSDAALTSGLSGVLVNENFASLPVLGIWDDVSATAIINGIPGDHDGDGDVDGDDLAGIQRDFGTSTTAQDFIDWKGNYGTTSGSVAAVPEPGSLAATCSLLVLVGACRRRR